MARMMKLQEAVNFISEKLNGPQMAKLLGVSENQIYKYKTGYTKTCSDRVVDAIYDNFKINKEPILLDIWNDEEEYLEMRELKESLGD